MTARVAPDAVAAAYGERCLRDLGLDRELTVTAPAGLSRAWRDSHLADLIGTPGTPLDCPLPLPPCADGVMAALNALLPSGRRIPWLGRRLLGMRRLSHPLRRGGAVSPSGTCRLLRCADGMLAVNLPRTDDWELVPAWLGGEMVTRWEALQDVLAGRPLPTLLARGRELGLALAPVVAPDPDLRWCQIRAAGERCRPRRPPRVLDFSSLWAGPSCTQLLYRAGAEVLRIEHPGRPDGARRGPPLFFEALNAGKQTLALDLQRSDDRRRLAAELAHADIVVEAFRPRVLRQLGVVAEDWLAAGPGRTWLSITGYGRAEPEANWIAFGDDAAVAGGLSAAMRSACGEDLIVGDAIADPLTGLHAALAAWAGYQAGGGRLISVPLCGVVAHCLTRSPTPP